MVMSIVVCIEIVTAAVGFIGGMLVENRRYRKNPSWDVIDAYALGKNLFMHNPELKDPTAKESFVQLAERHERRKQIIKDCGLDL